EAQKWAEWNQRWEAFRVEDAKKWEEQQRKWDEWNQRWEQERAEEAQKWAEWNQRWEAFRVEDAKKWEENSRRFEEVHQEILAVADRLGRQIQALGARWGISSERAFREALAGILSKTFGVEVLHVIEFDQAGEVFGRPDQIELDVIIRNGILILCELKSSLDKGDIYLFERKARFYEKLHQRRADRLIAISPYATARAREVAAKLGIEVYSDASEVPPS
ncbi:MAG: PD-(D/E)XK nuclease family protein, partial [Methylohalobius sp.]